MASPAKEPIFSSRYGYGTFRITNKIETEQRKCEIIKKCFQQGESEEMAIPRAEKSTEVSWQQMLVIFPFLRLFSGTCTSRNHTCV